MFPLVWFHHSFCKDLQRTCNLCTSCSVLQELSGRVQRAMWSFGVEFAECSYVIKEIPLAASRVPSALIELHSAELDGMFDSTVHRETIQYTPVHYEMSDCPVWFIHTMNALMVWTLDHWSWSTNMKLVTQKSPQTVWNCIESYGISHETYLDLALDVALGVWSNLVMQEAIEEMLKVPWRSYHGC